MLQLQIQATAGKDVRRVLFVPAVLQTEELKVFKNLMD